MRGQIGKQLVEPSEMLTAISIFLALLTSVVAIPVAVLLVEAIASCLLPRASYALPPRNAARPKLAVLVPAHNEGAGMLPTLADIKAQLRNADRLVVVADNCEDDTAAVAATLGAEVVVRNDPGLKGKGYALAAGLHHLATDPPDVVVIIDADCRLAESAIDRLGAACATFDRPAQASDFMASPTNSPINYRVAEFAWLVKNWVRPLGLRTLGMPCQLMGTGMAFPWKVLRSVDLATGSIVEDLKLGVDLALAGYPPVFCPFPGVTSNFPASIEGAQSQRLRWEQGHLETILALVPRLLFEGCARARPALLMMALDLSVPPLSLLIILIAVLGMLNVLMVLLGCSATAMQVSIASFAAFIVSILISWLKYGRGVLPPTQALAVVSYVVRKIPTYGKILFGMTISQWVRTDRTKL